MCKGEGSLGRLHSTKAIIILPHAASHGVAPAHALHNPFVDAQPSCAPVYLCGLLSTKSRSAVHSLQCECPVRPYPYLNLTTVQLAFLIKFVAQNRVVS